jgi:hypothetical protein
MPTSTAPRIRRNERTDQDYIKTSFDVPIELDKWIREFCLRTGRNYRGVIIMALHAYKDTR